MHHERFASLDQELTKENFSRFREEFEEYFGSGPIRMAVGKRGWREAYAGPQEGVRMLDECLVRIDNGILDQDGDYIILIGTCRYGFADDGLYIMSAWDGRSSDRMVPLRKMRKHFITQA